MELVIACGSVFIGCATIIGWLVWSVPRYVQSGTFKVQGLVRERPTTLRRRRPTRSRLGMQLMRAGYRGPGWLVIVLGMKMLSIFLAGVVGLWAYENGRPASVILLGTMAVAGFGFMVPEGWLSMKINERAREVNHYLTDMLDLLVVCLEAGLSFNASLTKVASEIQWSSPVLSDELQYTNHEIQMGRTRAEALRNLGDRCNNEDFNNLLAIIVQAEKFGMSMAKTLRTQVEAMRQKRRQKIQQIIQTIPVKMLFPLIMFIFPNLFVVILGPALITIVTNWRTK